MNAGSAALTSSAVFQETHAILHTPCERRRRDAAHVMRPLPPTSVILVAQPTIHRRRSENLRTVFSSGDPR
jgi:hypothetical protein